jgi:hypothetical protein
MAIAFASGGKGAADKVMADVLEVPASKAGQAFTVMAGQAASYQESNTKAILAGKMTAEQVLETAPKQLRMVSDRAKEFGDGFAYVMGQTGSEVGMMGLAMKNTQVLLNNKTDAEIKDAMRSKAAAGSLAGQVGAIQNKTADLTTEVNIAMGKLSKEALPNVMADLGHFADALKMATDKINQNPGFWYETIKNTAISIGVLGTVIASTIGIAKTAELLKMVRGGPGILGGGAAKVAGPAAGSMAGWKAGATASQGAVGATSRIGAGAAASTVGGAATTAGGVAKGLAKGAGVGLAIYGADYVAGKAGLGGKEVNEAQDEKNWQQANFWEKMQSSVARGIEHVGDFVAPNLANQARTDRIASETQYLKEKKDKEAAKANNTPETTEAKTGSGASAKTPEELMIVEIKNLNTTMNAVLRTSRIIVENTENTRKAVEQLDNDFFHRS